MILGRLCAPQASAPRQVADLSKSICGNSKNRSSRVNPIHEKKRSGSSLDGTIRCRSCRSQEKKGRETRTLRDSQRIRERKFGVSNRSSQANRKADLDEAVVNQG